MRLLLSPPNDAFTNMALDEALALTADTTPAFRVYYWSSPSISIGYSQRALEVLDSLTRRGTLQRAPTVVRRPTGGTAVLHNDQPSFSLVLRMRADVRQGYHLLGQVIIEALKTLGVEARLWDEKGSVNSSFCTSNLSPCDVISQGQKVAGYSARRWQGHSRQGTTLFQGYLHLPEPVGNGHLVEAMIIGMEKITEARLMEGNLTEAETVLTQELRQKKYIQQDWNYKR